MLLKTNKIKRDKNITLRVTEEELNRMKLSAQMYTGGCLTTWIVYTAMRYKPKFHEILRETPAKSKTKRGDAVKKL